MKDKNKDTTTLHQKTKETVEDENYRDLELDELAHGIQQVLEHAITKKDNSRDQLSQTHAQQRRLEHALIYSKLKLLPRHPSQVYATLERERKQHRKDSRDKEKRIKLLSSQLRCTQEECRGFQTSAERRGLEVEELKNRCISLEEEVENLKCRMRSNAAEAEKKMHEATVAHQTKLAQCRTEYNDKISILKTNIASLEHALKQSKKETTECQLELLELGERQHPSCILSPLQLDHQQLEGDELSFGSDVDFQFHEFT